MVNQNRKLFFLVALPRSGNTLFSSIINQNPEIACTANSVTLEIIKNIYLIKTTNTFKNFPDHKSLDNILDNVYNLYYKDWSQKIIIDRGPVMLSGNPGNFELMQKHFKPGFKCIVLLRNLMDVLASYMQWYTENPDSFVNKLGNTDEEKLLALMDKQGVIVKELNAIQNAFKNPSICHFVKYDDMVANPEKTFIDLYQFLGIKPFKHSFQELKQVEVNGMKYDDTIVGKNMHKIRTVIRKEYNPYIEKIPERIKNEYQHVKF